jgi:hypothetical protein
METVLFRERWPQGIGRETGRGKWHSAGVTLRCLTLRQPSEVNHIRGLAVQSRVRPALVMEGEVPGQAVARLGHGVVGMQVDLFVRDALSEPLDEAVVAPRALPVHAERDAV